MRRYVVLLADQPGDGESATEDVRQEYVAAHHAFEAYVGTHGRLISSAARSGADTATTLRHADGEPTVTDGPFVEIVEQVAGYYDVELPDLDSAIEAGRLLPSAYAVETRPVLTIEGYE